jgi:co-chaperonin GroES (HSP10)
VKNEAGLKLTGLRALVRLPKIERYSKGGIELPDSTYDKENQAQTTGVFIDAADAAWIECKELDGVKRGDTVFFARYSGAGCEFKIKEVPYRVMNGSDIIGVLEPGVQFDGQFKAAQTSMETFGLADAPLT